MAFLDRFKKKKIIEDPKVEDLLLKTDEELKLDNQLMEPLPKLVPDEEAFYQKKDVTKEEVPKYKARRS